MMTEYLGAFAVCMFWATGAMHSYANLAFHAATAKLNLSSVILAKSGTHTSWDHGAIVV